MVCTEARLYADLPQPRHRSRLIAEGGRDMWRQTILSKRRRTMATVPRTIKVHPGSELATILEEAREHPIVLQFQGECYRLDRLSTDREDSWEGYDAEAVRAALDKYAGSVADVDPDAWIAQV